MANKNYSKMNTYKNIAAYYDDFQSSKRVSKYIETISREVIGNKLENLDILEMACGTGEILSTLSKKNRTFGIDLSPEMLEIAKKKDSRSQYEVADMRNFSLDQKFDLILCPFDSINHLLTFSDWVALFSNVYKHLKKGGHFVFDCNNYEKFKKIDGKKKRINLKNGFVEILTTLESNICTWNIKVVVSGKTCTECTIKESAFGLEKINSSLKKIFSIIKLLEIEDGRDMFFCKK